MSFFRPAALAASFAIIAAAPAGPVAAQATPAPTQFLLFFGFGMKDLTIEAQATLDEGIKQAKARSYSHVLIDGYTDRALGPKQSMTLSAGMVASVRSYLVMKGIRADSIRTKAWGSAEPMRPTKPGVREPLNRRVAVKIVWN